MNLWRHFTRFLRLWGDLFVTDDNGSRIPDGSYSSITWDYNNMQASITRNAVYDAPSDLETYSTSITFTYLDGVNESSTREVVMYAESNVSQDEADALAVAELRDRIIVMTNYLDAQFPAAV